jgi:hypothetical protein
MNTFRTSSATYSSDLFIGLAHAESRVNNMVYDSDVNSAITETTSVPYVEIFVGDTSSVGNLSEKPDTANSIFTTTDTNNMYTDDFDLDTEEYILATDVCLLLGQSYTSSLPALDRN